MVRKTFMIPTMVLTALLAMTTLLSAQHFVYVANYNQTGSNVLGYSVGSSGQLTSIGPFAAPGNPHGVATDPLAKFLFVASEPPDDDPLRRFAGYLSSYRIGATGALTAITSVDEGVLRSIAVHPTGNFVYVGAVKIGSFGVARAYQVDSTGNLTFIGNFESGYDAVSITVDPSGRFLYTLSFDNDGTGSNASVFAHAIGPTGALTPIGSINLGLDFSLEGSVAVDPTGKFLYVTWAQNGDQVYAFSIGSTGALTLIGTAATGNLPTSVAVDNTGKFAYVTNGSGSVSAYSIGVTGALTAIGSPVGVGVGPRYAVTDPTAGYFYVIHNPGNTVSSFNIGATGAPTLIGSPLATGQFPQTAAVAACHPVPAIAGVGANPAQLWPPNHQMVNVQVSYTTTAPCGTPICTLSIASNESANGRGDGNASPDWTVLDPHHVELRAERSGNRTGRIYTITISCTDSAGNSTNKSTAVTVPKDQ